jgi:hypothetical protein
MPYIYIYIDVLRVEFKDKFKAGAEPVPAQTSSAKPMPSNRMDINTVLLQHRTSPSSMPVVKGTDSTLDLTLPLIVLPPPSALSLGSTFTEVPAFGRANGRKSHSERPDF